MAQDDQHMLRCSYSGGSKKMKQKKVPQRGLGVAQLEKMILEEQQKKEILAKNAFGSSLLALQCSNFRPSSSLCPNIENNSDAGGGDLVMCHNLIGFEPQVNLAYDQSNAPILSHKFQRPPSCSSLVKSSSGISSVISTQMELPSIQSFRCKNYALTEEEKMIGMKRSYPFSLESPQTSSLQCNFHHSHAISLSKSDELASISTNEYTLHMEPRNKFIRESVSNSSPPEKNPNELTSDNLRLNGDFLTLAPPAVASPPLDQSGRHTNKLYENECIPRQEYGKSQTHRPETSGSIQNSFSFFPIKLQTYQTTACVSSGNGEKGETIDLNLKL